MRGLWSNPKDRRVDLTVVGAFGLIVVALTFAAPPGPDLADPRLWSALAFHLAVVALLIPRRRHPIAVGVAVTAATAVIAASMYVEPGWLLDPRRPADVWISVATPVAAYSAAMFAERQSQAWTVVTVLALLLARPWEPSWPTVPGALLFTVLPATVALRRRAQRRLLASYADRAEQAERERHLLAEAARAEERTRLAGEVHDVVSHRVVLMVLHAEALKRSAADDGAREAAETLAATGRQALAEMRDLVGVLRGERGGEDADNPPGPADLARLAAEAERLGYPVELVEHGERRMSPLIGRTVHRIVREALTNVRKHAAGAGTTVHVRHEPERVRLTVRNGGGGSGTSLGGTGTGLLGLRQRAELVGGTLTAGPLPDGGFQVEAVLPAHVAAE